MQTMSQAASIWCSATHQPEEAIGHATEIEEVRHALGQPHRPRELRRADGVYSGRAYRRRARRSRERWRRRAARR
jgi:hypothetical protein